MLRFHRCTWRPKQVPPIDYDAPRRKVEPKEYIHPSGFVPTVSGRMKEFFIKALKKRGLAYTDGIIEWGSPPVREGNA